jgi:quinol monooxygenase YgiN
MAVKRFFSFCALLSFACLWGTPQTAVTAMKTPLVRLAELEIDPTQVEAYKAALKEEISASIAAEPGVLNLYAVSVKEHPAQIRIFEVYADQATYEAHLQTPHFKKYKSGTQGMVKSLKLTETDPILLGAKRGQH